MTAPAHHLPDISAPLIEEPVGDVLRRQARDNPDRPALAWMEGEQIRGMTYAELLAEASRVASWLLTHGSPGDGVAIWSRNSVEWVLVEYGCALAGMVIAAWNPGWTDYELRHAYELTTPVAVLAGLDTRGVSMLDRARALAGADKVFDLDALRAIAADAPARDLPVVDRHDLFLLQFTSGTTGQAKGAGHSHRSALNGAWLRFHEIGADSSDVWVNPSPMHHMGGAITMLLGNLVTGACYVIMPRFDAGELLRNLKRFGGTRTGGVPTMLLAMLDHPEFQPGVLRLKSIGSGGAQLAQPVAERIMREFGCDVLIAFGQSETPIVTSSKPGDDPRLLAETVGKVSAHVELKVVDPATGATVGRGETGEICVRGPMVMCGYYRNAEATAATIDADGFLHTGDLGALDMAGYIRLHGRARDVIIRGGENIYPAEVEDALMQHPAVGQCAVVGVPDDRWGQIVGAAVLLRSGGAVTSEELEAFIGTRISHFKLPRRWKFVDAFPLTPSAKIRKVDVETWFRED